MNDESGFDEAISADLTDGMNKNRKGHARPALTRRLSIGFKLHSHRSDPAVFNLNLSNSSQLEENVQCLHTSA
jgi:hypothetical protein